MNWVLVGLVILVVIFVYLLYYFSRAVSLLQGVTALSTVSSIPGNKLEKSSGSNVYYDFWLFVISPPASETRILSREFNLYLNGSTLGFKTNPSAGSPALVATDSIVAGLPVGKWVFVAININQKVLEVYFNGKLVKTISMKNALNVSNSTSLVVGSTLNAYITKLRRLTKNMTADFVWSKYLEGNGQFIGLFGGLLNYIDSYSAKVTLINGDKKKELKLF